MRNSEQDKPASSKTSSHGGRKLPLSLWAVSLLVLLGLGTWTAFNLAQVNAGAVSSPPSNHFSLTGKPALEGFHLLDAKGELVSAEKLRGVPSLFFFGYTHCPEVCPTTMNDIRSWLAALGPDASKLKVRFVSIDTDMDSPQSVGDFVQNQGADFEGFVVTPEALPALKKQFFLHVERNDAEAQESTGEDISHTSSVFMVSASGHFVGTLSNQEKPAAILQKIRQLLVLPKDV